MTRRYGVRFSHSLRDGLKSICTSGVYTGLYSTAYIFVKRTEERAHAYIVRPDEKQRLRMDTCVNTCSD